MSEPGDSPMLEFQFYFFPWSKWREYLKISYDSFDDLVGETTAGPLVVTHNYLCIGPLQWRWYS